MMMKILKIFKHIIRKVIMEKSTPSVMFFISLSCVMLILCSPFTVKAMEKVYTLSYSPGSLFHQLVRDRTRVVYKRAVIKVEFILSNCPGRRVSWL